MDQSNPYLPPSGAVDQLSLESADLPLDQSRIIKYAIVCIVFCATIVLSYQFWDDATNLPRSSAQARLLMSSSLGATSLLILYLFGVRCAKVENRFRNQLIVAMLSPFALIGFEAGRMSMDAVGFRAGGLQPLIGLGFLAGSFWLMYGVVMRMHDLQIQLGRLLLGSIAATLLWFLIVFGVFSFLEGIQIRINDFSGYTTVTLGWTVACITMMSWSCRTWGDPKPSGE